MCEMTSTGEISAASTTTPLGDVTATFAEGRGDFRRALTTSFTPRFKALLTAAVGAVSDE